MTATALGALLIIITGVVLRRTGLVRAEDGPVLVRIVLYVALPPLVFLILVHADLSAELLLVPVAAFLIHGVLLLVGLAVARAWRMDRPTTGAFLVCTAVGNTGFFGLPLIAASGAGFSQPAAVMYDALATATITWTSTVAIASAYGTVGDGRARVDLRALLAGLALPPTWALVAGLAWNLGGLGADLPDLVERPLEILAAAVLPLVMIYAGLMTDLGAIRRAWAVVSAITAVRLLVGPVVGLLVCLLLGLDGTVMHTVVIMAAMPTAMMSLVLGARYGLPSDVLAGAVVLTTLLCTVTLPLVRWAVL